MIGQGFPSGDSLIHCADPRVKIVTAACFAALVALSSGLAVPALALGPALLLVALARLPLGRVAGRLLVVNVFTLFLWLFVPFTCAGTPVWSLGPLTATREGVLFALAVTLKCNAIVLALMALVGATDIVRLGHALQWLRVPDKLVHLLLFTVRYFDVMRREYERLARAMRARRFRPGTSLHTYRCLGWLVGMLLLRSFERAERVSDAMRCRGFCGRFYLLSRFALARGDVLFAAAAAGVLGALGWMQWTLW